MPPLNRERPLDQATTDASPASAGYHQRQTGTPKSNLTSWLADQNNQDRHDWLAALLILALILLVFSKTVVLGLPISKISRLNEWDSLYGAFWTGRGGNCDPSIVQLLVPYYFLVAKIWTSGHLPLWNPFSGFGTPLIGDIQAGVFSPLRLVFDLNPRMHTYNLLLVSEVLGAAVCTFLAARALEFKRYTCLFAALTFALCPYNLHYLETMSGPSFCLLPALIWLFVRVAQNPTVGRASLAGIGCAAAILSGHPENSFFNISFAALLMVALMFFAPSSKTTASRQLIDVIGSLFCAGLVAFCLSAPVLLPFLEYLLNSDSYKFGIGGSTWVPWQGIGYNLLQPGFGEASPFLGIISAVVLPLSILLACNGRRRLLSLLIVALTAFAFTARLGLLNDIFITKPFNCLITVYCLPVFLLLATLVCAGGLEELVENTRIGINATFITLLLAIVLVFGLPWLLHTLHLRLAVGDFDMMIPHMDVNFRIWFQQIGLLSAAILVFVLSKRCSWMPRAALPLTLLVVTFISQTSVAKGSLPIQTKFAYPAVDPIPLLQRTRDRLVAIGDHLCRPSTTAVYGVADIRTHNPLFPNRYTDFMKGSGAQVDMFNQLFKSASSKLLDVANVRYVLSLEPLADADKAPGTRPDLHLITTTSQGIRVYERRNYLPRAYIVHNWLLASSGADALRIMSTEEFNPRAEAVIESPLLSMPQTGAASSKPEGQVKIEFIGPNQLRLSTAARQAGLLVLADTYYPGWVARLDGAEVPIIRANYLFRGVAIPSGEHQLVFEYRPLSFFVGAALASGCIALLILLAVLQSNKTRRQSLPATGQSSA
jgi:hypothetical protein